MDTKKGAPSSVSPFFAKDISVKPKKEEPKKTQTKTQGTNYLVLVGGFFVLFLLSFFFFRFVVNLDKLYSFDDNLNEAVSKVSGYGVGTVKEVVIPLPNSVDQVCFFNDELSTEVSLEPEKAAPFSLNNVLAVESVNLCVPTAGSFRVKMQVFSRGGLSFVGIFLNSIDQQIVNPVYVETKVTQGEVPPAEVQNQTSSLTDVQQASCQFAAQNNNCASLAGLGVVTKEDCCSVMSLCC